MVAFEFSQNRKGVKGDDLCPVDIHCPQYGSCVQRVFSSGGRHAGVEANVDLKVFSCLCNGVFLMRHRINALH